ncbi:MAG: hypothetical protein VXY77_01595 [Pseudomonadota bacterium]|nr:hypothetical protein [Pseudomonadota bacterium]
MTILTRQYVKEQIQSSQDPTVFIVPDGITKIEEKVFKFCTGLKQRTLPESLKRI